MAIVCPTVTAFDTHTYREQIERIAKFAKRIHVDLMDGVFAPTKSPDLSRIWLPDHVRSDIHLMYQKPMESLGEIIRLKPHLVVIPAEADVHHMHFAAELHKHDIEAGIAILQDTSIERLHGVLNSFDHVLVFSGSLGRHGGVADLGLLHKVEKIKDHHPDAEISWDGGISDKNAKQLVDGGIDVLNAGGFIQKAEDPEAAYDKLVAVIKK